MKIWADVAAELSMSAFQLIGPIPEQFSHLDSLSASQLDRSGIMRVTPDSKSSFPRRISLQDAGPGDELLLLPYGHQPACSPYRASGPIYVRVGARKSILRPGQIPPYVSHRLISVRSYDIHHMMVLAEICPGDEAAAQIQRQISDPRVSYIHLHNARRGSFSCRVERTTAVERASVC